MGSTKGDDAAHLGFRESLRRQRNHGGGGFLLETPIRHPRPTSSLFQEELQSDRKGKRKSETPESSRRKRQSQIDNGPNPSSTDSAMSKGTDVSNETRRSYSGSLASQPASREGSSSQNGRIGLNNQRPASDVGFDSDPAQIVDMALRLSERRRRQASSNGYAPAASPSQRRVSQANGSVDQTRLQSHNIESAQTPVKSPPKEAMLNQELNAADVWSETSGLPTTSTDAADNILTVSKATMNRAQKAKTYIELAYEHRRLLPHLPPIRRPGSRPAHGSELLNNKVYNPLQYARNRKLRLREKSGLNAELDGWHDVKKVREWVDAAIDSHTETKHDPLECVRLPPLSQSHVNGDGRDQIHPNSPQDGRQAARPRRPKSDWVTHPADLLADAYWLEQGLNKTKIQDRDNNNIYPPDTQFKYAGWRRQANSAEVPASLQHRPPTSTSTNPMPPDAPPISSAPKLPKFRPTQRNDGGSKRLRGSRNVKRSLISDAKDSTRKALEIFEQSSASSSDTASTMSDSDSDSQQRGRRKAFTKTFKFDLPGGDPFSSHVSSSSGQGTEDTRTGASKVPTVTHDDTSRPSLENRRLSKFLGVNGRREKSSGSKESSPQHRHQPEDQARSSGEYGTVSPASPVNYGLPSIAINLSPTNTRSMSPTKKSHKVFRSLREKHRGKDDTRTETTDFAENSPKSHSRDPSTDADRSWTGSGNDSRGTSPFNKTRRGSSPYEAPKSLQTDHRGSTMSRHSTASNVPSVDHHSRIRGMFKGGRIAEIVGNEVSKVGDYIWKRDPPNGRYHTSISESSLRSDDSSDTEDDRQGNIYKTPPRHARTSISSNSSHTDPRRSLEVPEQKSQYHNPNLPSFTSPFQRDRERQDRNSEALTPGTPKRSGDDHISLQVAQHRSRSRSPRFDRLAPPRLDTSGSGTDRRSSYGFGASLDLTKSRSASQIYNDAIGGASSLSHRDSKPTGAGSSQKAQDNGTEPAAKDNPPHVSKAEIMRIETLLMMSIVKSYGIFHKQDSMQGTNEDRERQSKTTQYLRLRQGRQNANAARHLAAKIAKHDTAFKDKLGAFSKSTVSNLHSEMQRLEDHIENSLTPRARVAADQAGELSMKLSTTSTRATKDMNDIISEAFRLRKRGPFRWLRRLGYGAIEWAVVSLLWIIWAIVTVVRIVLGTIRTGNRFVRWMLWID